MREELRAQVELGNSYEELRNQVGEWEEDKQTGVKEEDRTAAIKSRLKKERNAKLEVVTFGLAKEEIQAQEFIAGSPGRTYLD